MTNAARQDPIRRIEPLAGNWRCGTWAGGRLDTAGRPHTPEVEGIIRTPEHLVLVTLAGSASRLNVVAECGHRYEGPDLPGSVSFVPANVTRRLAMRNVASTWASIAIDPDLLDATLDGASCHAFSNRSDRFMASAVGALVEQLDRDGTSDPLYGEAITLALVRHLGVIFTDGCDGTRKTDPSLAPWKIARIRDFIESNIDQPISIGALARLADLSPGYFHRAFKATTGHTPLAYIQRCRIARARALLLHEDLGIGDVALRTGFLGPSHFARTFRALLGVNPAVYRRRRRGEGQCREPTANPMPIFASGPLPDGVGGISGAGPRLIWRREPGCCCPQCSGRADE